MSDSSPLVDEATVDSLRQLQQQTGTDLLHRVFEAYFRTAPETLASLRRACAENDLSSLYRSGALSQR